VPIGHFGNMVISMSTTELIEYLRLGRARLVEWSRVDVAMSIVSSSSMRLWAYLSIAAFTVAISLSVGAVCGSLRAVPSSRQSRVMRSPEISNFATQTRDRLRSIR